MKKDKTPGNRSVHPAAIAAAGVSLAFAAFGTHRAFFVQGIRGLLQWDPSWRLLFVSPLLASSIPLILLVIAVILNRPDKQRLPRLLVKISMLVSLLLIVALPVGGWLWFRASRVAPEKPYAGVFLEEEGSSPLARLAFSADPHIGSPNSAPDATKAILDSVRAGGYDAFFLLGDIAELGWPGTNLAEGFALLGRGLGTIPLATVMGNHDALAAGAKPYRNFSGRSLYYRIDRGTTHIVALNLLWGTETLGAAQRHWLERTLESIPRADTVIVVSHCFFYSSGYIEPASGRRWYDHEDTIGSLAPLFAEKGVDLVVSGHNHFMEYLEPDGAAGPAYVVIGAMGGQRDPERTYDSPASRWYRNDAYGFLDLTVGSDSLTLVFRDEKGTALATFTRDLAR